MTVVHTLTHKSIDNIIGNTVDNCTNIKGFIEQY